MADRVVLLSGEHETLPRAELAALLAVFDPDATLTDRSATVLQIHPGNDEATDEALRRVAMLHQVATYWGHGDMVDAVHAASCSTDGKGSIKVDAIRTGSDRSVRSGDAAREIGQALADAGHPIDLSNPEFVVTAWIDHGMVVVGRHLWHQDRSRFDARHVNEREHFSPVTMHPRRAASLLHLARAKPGGRVLDPFCGTGGIVLEAAIAGYEAIGSDIDNWMVQGTLQTLADAGPDPVDALVFQSDIGDVPDQLDPVDAIVTDLPYGRASSTDYEDVAKLYERAFASFAELLPIGRRAVIGCADAKLGKNIANHGFQIEEQHAEYVHASLTRHFIVARRH